MCGILKHYQAKNTTLFKKQGYSIFATNKISIIISINSMEFCCWCCFCRCLKHIFENIMHKTYSRTLTHTYNHIIYLFSLIPWNEVFYYQWYANNIIYRSVTTVIIIHRKISQKYAMKTKILKKKIIYKNLVRSNDFNDRGTVIRQTNIVALVSYSTYLSSISK